MSGRRSSEAATAATAVQRAWRARCCAILARARAAARDMCTCAVCGDECVRIVRCPNGHATCAGCAVGATDARCPVCREMRPLVADACAPAMLAFCRARLRCSACGTTSTASSCEFHRAWCPSYAFQCPFFDCHHTATAARMAAHVIRAHAHAHRLERMADGWCSFVTVVVRGGEEAVLVVGSDVVTLSSGGFRRMADPGGHALHIDLRAVYSGPRAHVLRAIVRQVRIDDCERGAGSCRDEHRIDAIAPVLASREVVTTAHRPPEIVLVQRSTAVYDLVLDGPRLLSMPNVRPSRAVADAARKAGLRDVPFTAPLLRKPHVPVSLLHVLISRDPSSLVGDVFDS